MATFWVVFAKCVGVVVVDGDSNVETIMQKTTELGCNPGPDHVVQMQQVRTDEIPGRYKNRLLTKDQVDTLNAGKQFH